MEIYKHYLTKNRCYKAYRKMTLKGIVVHSTGCNNKNVTRYVDESSLGSVSSNHWNNSDISKCVNGMIGYSSTKKKAVAVLTLPYDCKPWGCGSGSRGSYNNDHFQFEICEENGTDKTYFNQAWKLAVEWCAYICGKYNLSVSKVVSHAEAHDAGYATNHGDADSYFKKFGKTMSDFRSDVKKAMNKGTSTSESTETQNPSTPDSKNTYKVKVTADVLNVRKSYSASSTKVTEINKGEVYTIVETKNNWGKLKTGVGWINVSNKYVKKL